MMREERTSLRYGILMLKANVTRLVRFFQFMLWHVRHGRAFDVAKRAYRQLMDEIVERYSQIEVRDLGGNLVRAAESGNAWGAAYLDLDDEDKEEIQNGEKIYRHIYIPKSNVDRFLLENGFKNLKRIYRWWMGSLYIGVGIGDGGKRKIFFDVRIGDAGYVACIKAVMW